MAIKFSNNALTTLATSITNLSTTLAVAAATGDGFPAVAGGGSDYFVLTMEDSSGHREFIRVDNRVAGSDVLGSVTYPLERGYWGSTARTWSAGDEVDCRWTSQAADQFYADAIASGTLASGGPTRAFGQNTATTTGLTFGYYGGILWVDGVITTIADGVVTLAASQTNYVERTGAGVVSSNTTAFTTGLVPLLVVTTSAGAVASVVDKRISSPPFTGRLSKSVAGAVDVTLNADEARNPIVEMSGAITANINLIVPATKQRWTVRNGTSGAFTVTFKTPSGTGVSVPQGKALELYGNGTDILSAVDGVFTYTVGVAANNLVQLDGAAKLPAVDGSQLTNLPLQAIPVVVGTRQTVLSGAVDNSNLPNWLAAGTGLAVDLKATTVAVRLAYASGLVDTQLDLTADAANQFGTLPANSTLYLFADRLTGTTFTGSSSRCPPQYGGSFDSTSGRFLLHFDGAPLATTFLDDWGSGSWAAVGSAKLQNNQAKFGATALGGSGTNNALIASGADRVRNASITSLPSGGWTLACQGWATAQANGINALFSLVNGSGLGLILCTNASGKVQCGLSSNGGSFDIVSFNSGTATIATGSWHAYELSWDGSNYRIKVDGVLDQTIASSLPICPFSTGFCIGGDPLTSGRGWQGYIDEVEMVPYCRHPGASSYTAPTVASAVNTAGELACWFDVPNMTMREVSGPNTVTAGGPVSFTARNRVFVGEADTGASSVSAIRAYAYRGYYDQTFTTTAVLTVKNHNLGVQPGWHQLLENGVTQYRALTLTNDTISWTPGAATTRLTLSRGY